MDRPWFVRILVFATAALMPVGAWAACTCGNGDAQYALPPMTVDGNFADWGPVHADPDNNVCDGPINGLTDLDAPVQSTGRDIVHFAITWDQNQLYLFTERAGSASNIQRFIYYADVDDDGLMETGEPIIAAVWRGSNRRVDVFLFTYVAQAAGGDPMVDAQGNADGYTLPGSFANVPSSPARSGTWGSVNGRQMEFSVSWAELGVTPGSAFTFHVSSTNSALGASDIASKIDDNLSGCGGGIGSTRQPALTFTPDWVLTALAGSSVAAAHTVSNTGNTQDTYDITSTISGAHSPALSYYRDVDGSGTLNAGDSLLVDTDGDGIIDTGDVAVGASVQILVVYQVDAAASGTATITTTARSSRAAVVAESVQDTIEAIASPNISITKSVMAIDDPVNGPGNAFSIPGAIMLYTVIVQNSGPGQADNNSLTITDPIPVQGALKVDDIQGAGSGPVSFIDGTPSSNLAYTFGGLADPNDDLEFSNDGGTTFTYVPTADPTGCDAAVTHIRISPSGAFAADTGAGSPSAQFQFRFRIN